MIHHIALDVGFTSYKYTLLIRNRAKRWMNHDLTQNCFLPSMLRSSFNMDVYSESGSTGHLFSIQNSSNKGLFVRSKLSF